MVKPIKKVQVVFAAAVVVVVAGTVITAMGAVSLFNRRGTAPPGGAVPFGTAKLSGAPDVRTSERNGIWTIEGVRNSVELDAAGIRLSVRAGKCTWRFLPSFAGDLVVRPAAKAGAAPVEISLRLADAAEKKIEPYQTGYMAGLKLTLAGFRRPAAASVQEGQSPISPSARSASPSPSPDVGLPNPRQGSIQDDSRLDLTIQIFIGLEGRDEDLIVRVIASDGEARAREILFPPSFEPASFDHTVVPFMQGMLLPKAWPRQVRLYDEISYGRGLYMPWWGHQQAGAAVLVLLETPADAGIRFSHPAGGPTRADVRWVHSLGRWSAPRSVRYSFIEKGNYVALAKRYRRHIIEMGHFVSLKEKIARNPLVANLVGSPVIHTSILYHVQPDSSYYKKDDPAANHQLVTFDKRAAELRKLAGRGVRRAYVHLDGWGFRGYDNLHPDILPPSPEAGGWEGMKRFADACAELGFVFGVHDQYRDYYEDAASYDPRHTVMNEDGGRPEHAIWYGGRQSILCTSLAPGYVRRNFSEILAHGIKVRGAYLDVFSVVPGDECYSPEHPVTRAESLSYRGECLDFVRSWGGVASSEEAADWAIPHLDLVHHAPHALDPDPGHGPAMGIPVPLYSLVYHDALLVPWSLGKGAWGIPEEDLGFLYGLGNAGLPYLSIEPTDEELKKVRTMSALHGRVGLMELVNHEFLDVGDGQSEALDGRGGAMDRQGGALVRLGGALGTPSKTDQGMGGGLWRASRKQRFTYADGTRVTVDFAASTFEISPRLAGQPTAVSFFGGENR